MMCVSRPQPSDGVPDPGVEQKARPSEVDSNGESGGVRFGSTPIDVNPTRGWELRGSRHRQRWSIDLFR